MFNYGIKVNLTDAISVPLGKIADKGKSAFVALGTSINNFKSKITTVEKSVDELNTHLDSLTTKRNISLNISEIANTNRQIQETENRLERLQNMGKSEVWKNLGTGVKTAIVGSVIGGIAGFAAFAQSSFGEGSARTTQESVLKNKLGSSQKANSELERVGNFAQDFGLDEKQTRESFIKLSNQGKTPTNQRLENWGNIVARTGGKNMDQFAEGLLDAQGGEFVRLQEFGIRGKQDSKTGLVTLLDTVSGYKKTIKSDGEEIMKYLDEVAQQAGTKGMLAAKAATPEAVITRMSNFYERIQTDFMGGLQPNIGGISDAVMNLGSILQQYAAPAGAAFGRVVVTIANGLASTAKYVGDNLPMLKEFGVIIGIATTAWGLYSLYTNAAAIGQWALNVAMSANPVGAIIVGVAALAAGIVYLYHESETFRGIITTIGEYGKLAFNAIWEAGKFAFNMLWPVAKFSFAVMTASIWVPIKAAQYLWDKFEGVRGVIYAIWEVGKVVFEKLGNAVKNVLGGIGTTFKGLNEGNYGKAWEGAKQTGKGALGLRPVGLAINSSSDVAQAAKKGYAAGVQDFQTEKLGSKPRTVGAKSKKAQAASGDVFGGIESMVGGFFGGSDVKQPKSVADSQASGDAKGDKGDRVGVKNVYIQIDALIKEQQIHVSAGIENFKQKLKSAATEVVLEAANDFNVMGGQ